MKKKSSYEVFLLDESETEVLLTQAEVAIGELNGFFGFSRVS